MSWPTPPLLLQWFDSSKYMLTVNQTDNICIAPTTSGRRCNWDISPEELHEVNEIIFMTLEQRERSGDRDLLQRMILLRCCGDQHRQKLEKNLACLSELVQLYRDCIAASPASWWTRKRREQLTLRSPPRTTSPMVDRNGRFRRRYELRSRQAGPYVPQVQSSLFVPYSRAPVKTVGDIIVNSVPSNYDLTGEVYSLIWPSQPGFFKVGYTKNRAESRADHWRNCHRGVSVMHRIRVPYPKRMEQLIHLELESKRQEIVVCGQCHHTHDEWFEISPEDIIQVMNTWKEVIDREAIYDNHGSFSMSWRQRINRIAGDVSARSLLHVLTSETKVVSPRIQVFPTITEFEVLSSALGRLDDTLAKVETVLEARNAVTVVEDVVDDVVVVDEVAPVYLEEGSLPQIFPSEGETDVENAQVAKPCAPEDSDQKQRVRRDDCAIGGYQDWGSMLVMFNDFMHLISVVC